MNPPNSIPFSISEAVRQMLPYIMEMREYFHAHPEPGGREFDTCKTVFQELSLMGVQEVKIIAGTGVTGLIHGALPGPLLLLRAAIDAQRIKETHPCAYASLTEGLMHAAGHDGETAVLLGIAKILCKHRQTVQGTVRLVFEPAVSATGKAAEMIDAGILHAPRPDMALTCHWNGNLPLETVAFRAGYISPCGDEITLTVKREPTALAPSLNPLWVGTRLVCKIYDTLAAHRQLPADTLIFNQVDGGTSPAILPESVTWKGILRTPSPTVRQHILQRMETLCRDGEQAPLLSVRLLNRPLAPPLENTPLLCKLAHKIWHTHAPHLRVSAAMDSRRLDDFSYIAARIPAFTFDAGIYTRTPMPIDSRLFIWDSDILKSLCLTQLTLVLHLPRYFHDRK